MRQQFAFLSVLLLSAAGCVAAPATAPPDAGPSATVDAGSDQGGVRGQVVDEELRPVAGAEVGMPKTTLPTAVTDADGRFAFSDVEPGTHSIIVQKLGFESVGKSIVVAAGEATDVTITLKMIAVAVARSQTFSGDGYVDLAVGAYNQQLWPIIVNVSSFRRNWFYFKIAEDSQSIVTLLRWTPATAVHTKYLEHALYAWPGGSGASQLLNYTKGVSPLRLRSDELPDVMQGKKDQFYMGFRLMPCDASCPPDALVQLAVEQRMSLYATVFYVQPAPEGFAAGPP